MSKIVKANLVFSFEHYGSINFERNAEVQREHLASLRPPAKTGSAHYVPEIEQSKLSWVEKQLLCLAKHGTPIGGSCEKYE